MLRRGLTHETSAQYFACCRNAFAAASAQTELARKVAQGARAFAGGLFDLAVGDRFAYADIHAANVKLNENDCQ